MLLRMIAGLAIGILIGVAIGGRTGDAKPYYVVFDMLTGQTSICTSCEADK